MIGHLCVVMVMCMDDLVSSPLFLGCLSCEYV
jgi:hypothetical protein